MDLTRTVRYRGFNLNGIRHDADTRDMVGCEVTRAAYHGVMGVAYDEKKAMADGHDSGDVWLGKRAIQLQGNLYGRTRPELFDILTDFMARLSPTAAYDQSPSNKGYLPLDFYLPSNRTSWPIPDPPWEGYVKRDGTFGDGLRHVIFLARPVSLPQVEFTSDGSGGADNGALSLPWNAVLEARLPWMLAYDYTSVAMGGKDNDSGGAVNEGNRPASFEVRLVVPPKFNGGDTGRWRLTGLGTNMYFDIPSVNSQQTFRYDSYHKVLSVNGRLRMDLLRFSGNSDHGRVAPGQTSWSWHTNGDKNLRTGSYFRWRATWA